MPKRKEPELTPEEQFKKFVETARKHGVDESGRDLEQAFSRVARRPSPTAERSAEQSGQKARRDRKV